MAGTIGTVLAVENADIYTYVQLDLGGEQVWYAVPTVELKVGEKVTAPDGMPMKNFHSKTLDRTFEVVYFADALSSPSVAPQTAGALPAGHPPIQPAAAPSYDFSNLRKPDGAKTVAEIYSTSAELAGSRVTVCGIAVKVSNEIMGKNWVHVQDGTGVAGSNDLTITTTNTVEVGATVTASGTVATDLDFGYGYKYAVLLQDAEVKN